MIAYWSLFLLLLIVMYICHGEKTTYSLFFSMALIFIFFAFREGFTPDYEGYLYQFETMTWDEGRHRNEPLYQLMVINLSYRIALVIQTALYCFALFITFKCIPYKYWWFCLFLLFFNRSFLLGNMGGFRSCFVSALFLIAIKCKELFGRKKGTIIGLFLIIVSSLIHVSGWVMVIAFLAIGSKALNAVKRNIWVIGSIVIIFMSFFFGSTLSDLFNTVFKDNEDLETYMRNDIEDVIKIGTFTILRIALLFYILYVTLKTTTQENLGSIETVCVKFVVIFILLNLIPSIGLKERFYYYLALPTIIGASSIIQNEQQHMKGYLYCGAWIVYALWEYYLFVGKPTYVMFYSYYHNILFDL